MRKEVSAVLLRAGAARSCTVSSGGGGRTAGRGGRCWPRRSPGCTRTQSSRRAGFDGKVAWKTTRMCKSRVDIRSCQVHSRGTTRTGAFPLPRGGGLSVFIVRTHWILTLSRARGTSNSLASSSLRTTIRDTSISQECQLTVRKQVGMPPDCCQQRREVLESARACCVRAVA